MQAVSSAETEQRHSHEPVADEEKGYQAMNDHERRITRRAAIRQQERRETGRDGASRPDARGSSSRKEQHQGPPARGDSSEKP